MNKPNESVIRARAAVERLGISGELDNESLQEIVDGVIGEGGRSSHPIARLLAHLTGRFPAACGAVAALASDPRPHIRKRAMRCVGPDTPPDFALSIVENGLVDSDPLVRHAAMNASNYALGCQGAYGIALCLWGQDTEAVQWLSSMAKHCPTLGYAAALSYVQDVAAGRKPRPQRLADCLQELAAVRG
jgi:hypothetical protein